MAMAFPAHNLSVLRGVIQPTVPALKCVCGVKPETFLQIIAPISQATLVSSSGGVEKIRRPSDRLPDALRQPSTVQ